MNSICFHCVNKVVLCVCLSPQWKRELNSYRVEAAWRLSKWDLLDDYLGSGERTLLIDQVNDHLTLLCCWCVCVSVCV